MSIPNVFITKKDEYPEGNFITISKQITQWRGTDGELLSPQALALFFRLLSTPPNYIFRFKDSKEKFGMSREVAKRALDELQFAGFAKRVDTKNSQGHTIVIIYLRECLDLEFNSQVGFPVPGFQYRDSSTGKPVPEIGDQYINKYVQSNNKQLNILQQNNINKYTNSKEFEQENLSTKTKVLDQHVSHVSQNNSFSKELNITKQDWAAHHDKNQERTIADIMNVTDPKNEVHEKKRRRQENKNRVQQMEQEKGNSIRTIDMQVAHVLADMTQEDNEVARALKIANEITELNKKLNITNMKQTSNVKQMQKEADKFIQDVEVSKWFKEYLEVKIKKTGLMAKPTVQLLYEDLQSKACNDKNTMVIMLKEAIKSGWNGFYINDNIQKQVEALKQVQQNSRTFEPTEDDEYVELLDEHGNPIKF